MRAFHIIITVLVLGGLAAGLFLWRGEGEPVMAPSTPSPVAPDAEIDAESNEEAAAPAEITAVNKLVDMGIAAAVTPPNSPWDRQWTRFRENVEAAGLGFDYMLRGDAGTEEVILSNLRRNRVKICGCSLQGLASIVPELAVAMAPYMFESAEEVDFVYDNYLLEPLNALFAEKGIVVLEWVEVGWTDIFAQAPIVLPADAAGKKLRGSPNIAAQAFLSAIGADAISLGSTEIVPGLQTGLIDGGLGNTAFMYFSVRDYVSDVTLTRHSYDTGAIVANREWFETLDATQQEAVRTGFGPSELARREVREYIAGLQAELRQSDDIVIHALDSGQRAAWVEAASPAQQRIIAQVGGQAQAIYDAIQEGKRAFAAMKASDTE